MDDADLKALLGSGAPSAADPHFVLAVMARIEQRRFARERARTWAIGIGAMLLLVLLAPSLERAFEGMQVSSLVIALLLMTATLVGPQIFPAVRD